MLCITTAYNYVAAGVLNSYNHFFLIWGKKTGPADFSADPAVTSHLLFLFSDPAAPDRAPGLPACVAGE